MCPFVFVQVTEAIGKVAAAYGVNAVQGTLMHQTKRSVPRPSYCIYINMSIFARGYLSLLGGHTTVAVTAGLRKATAGPFRGAGVDARTSAGSDRLARPLSPEQQAAARVPPLPIRWTEDGIRGGARRRKGRARRPKPSVSMAPVARRAVPLSSGVDMLYIYRFLCLYFVCTYI